jgi:hypothetical protein
MQQRQPSVIPAIYVGPSLAVAFCVPVAMALGWPLIAAAGCIGAAAVVLRWWWYRHLLWLPVLAASAVEFAWAVTVLVRQAAA